MATISSFTRYLSRDVRDKMVSLLNSGGVDGDGDTRLSFNAFLATVDTKRSTATPTARSIGYRWQQNQKPYIIVDIEGSELDNESLLETDYELLPEVYTCKVMSVIKASTNQIQDYVENWIESIIGVLHGYCDSNITWISMTETDMVELYQQANQTEKAIMVEFEIRIN